MSNLDETTASGGIYDDRKEVKGEPSRVVERWMNEIHLAERVQRDWVKEASDARDMFRSEGAHETQRFNIQYSNVQTQLPALYSNTPTPDVRKRYHDKQDKDDANRIAAQIIERNISCSLDQYDFDGVMRGVVRNALLTGRGMPRVRHLPETSGEYVFNRVQAECTKWRDILFGPAEVWEDLPWLAFRHYMTREELETLNPRIGAGLHLDHVVDGAEKDDPGADRTPNVWKRAVVWEIWDKASRTVIWMAESHKAAPLRVDEDPLELIDFWPCPKPFYPSETEDTMVPMVPVKIIKALAEELEEVTKRIAALTKILKWRGFADPSLNLDAFENAVDGDLIPASEDISTLLNSGGLERHVWLMPIEQAVNVLQSLYVQREQIKQVIFEVSGISDIIRGASDPRETLGAQEMKANFGTLRIQDQQRMVQRLVRDTLRIKAELMCSHFEMRELLQHAGIKLPTAVDKQMAAQVKQQIEAQAQQSEDGQPPPIPEQVTWALDNPSVEDVERIIRDDMVRAYVIDIETDSTIQQDMRQVQANMSSFLEGTAAFLQSIGPMVQQGAIDAETAIDLYQPFARTFHLGKQAEDALERMSDKAKDAAKQPKQEQPDPAQVEADLKAKMFELESQHKQQTNAMDIKHAQDMQAMDAQAKQLELAFKEKSLQLKAQEQMARAAGRGAA